MCTEANDLFLVNRSSFLRLAFNSKPNYDSEQSWNVVYRDYILIPDEMRFIWDKEDNGTGLINCGKSFKRPNLRIRSALNKWINKIYDISRDNQIINSSNSDISKQLTSYKIFPGSVVEFKNQDWLVISSISYYLERKAVMLLPIHVMNPKRPYYSHELNSNEWIRLCLRIHHGEVPIFKNQTDSKYVDVTKWEKIDAETFLESSKFKCIISLSNMKILYQIFDVLFSIILSLDWKS